MSIPEAAVEAAWEAFYEGKGGMRKALEAAAPHIEKDAYERGWGAGFRHTSAAMKRAAQ